MNENKGSMIWSDEGYGDYHVRILMSREQCRELKLEYPIEVDVCVYEMIGSVGWEKAMREEIENALFETILPEDADDFYQEAWFEEIAWEWDLEEEQILSADKDPFSEKNKKKTLEAYRLLHFLMMADGRASEVNRLLSDGDYAKRLFEEYHIPNSPYSM